MIAAFVLLPIVLEITGVYVSGAWRYRLTVEVDTPEGVKTGSAVRQISNSNSIIKILDLPDVGNPASVKGEAVVVDLGARGTLFALIDDRSDEELYEAFPIKGASTVGGIRRYNWTLWPGMTRQVRSRTPKMVTFTDMNDPKSVKLVYDLGRGGSVNNFEEIFGAGVTLKDVTLTITWAPITWGVVDYLPWLPEYYNKRLDGNRYGTIKASNKIANSLSSGTFSTKGPSK